MRSWPASSRVSTRSTRSRTAARDSLWWVPAGYIPGIDEAKQRLAHLEEHGSTQFAFTFKTPFPPDEQYLEAFDWSVFKPCAMSAR